MSALPLNTSPGLPEVLAPTLAALAERNVFIGTSSWKHPGWLGQLYDEQRYLKRGKFVKALFKRACLSEYAAVFKTVCVDLGYLEYPTSEGIEGLLKLVPHDFKLCFKVSDEVTRPQIPNVPGLRPWAGKTNPHFLNAEHFQSEFLTVCQPWRERMGLIIFEFGPFTDQAAQGGAKFLAKLDQFFSQLPQGWQYGVEIRNPSLLDTGYFEMLRRHGVAHILNNWDRMPSVSEQMGNPEVFTNDAFTAARFLLKPGRSYARAAAEFGPFSETKEVNEEARSAAADLITRRLGAFEQGNTQPSFIFVSNRLEGNALLTIAEVLKRMDAMKALPSQTGLVS